MHKVCPTCGMLYHTVSVSDAIEIANSEQENNSPLGSCLWYLRVCELVEYEP